MSASSSRTSGLTSTTAAATRRYTGSGDEVTLSPSRVGLHPASTCGLAAAST